MHTAQIAVSGIPYNVDKPYEYRIPDALTGCIVPGLRVTVPFGRNNHRREGVVLSTGDSESRTELKEIESALETEPLITGEQIRLAVWMRERFFCTAFDAFRSILPAGLLLVSGTRRVNDKTRLFVSLEISGEEAWETAAQKKRSAPKQAALLEILAQTGEASLSDLLSYTGAGRESVAALEKQGLVSTERREVFRRPEVRASEPEPFELNGEQQAAFEALKGHLAEPEPAAALLFGVTGSGKTRVYIRLIEEVLSMGRSAIVLVPEIALTPQLVGIFASYFGRRIAVLHSSLGSGERYDEWKRIRSGEADIVIGTRSAVFAPVSRLGLIIMDEEQESSYKSEAAPRYHARDVARYRCGKAKALFLMGSATPDVGTMYHARRGDYRLYTLRSRFNGRALPGVITADMRRELVSGRGGDISEVLAAEIESNLKNGEQTILLLNRRGANTSIVCPACGYTFSCPRCSASLTYHSANHRLMCHYCGFSLPEPGHCPECSGELKYLGTGTQKVEQELAGLFPDIGIIRMDADTVALARSHERLLEKFRKERVPVLLGTQMIAKGLDFENVTLVGVLNADTGLYQADFRARERTFDMLSQVVGRAGRGERGGRAVIQTYTPDNEVIRLASLQDYVSFYENEIQIRKALQLPPFRAQYTVTCSGTDEACVLRTASLVADILRKTEGASDRKVLGPAPAPVIRINRRFHYRVTVYGSGTKTDRYAIGYAIRTAAADRLSRGVLIYADSEA